MQAKTEIAAEVKEALQKSMESFGFIIIETLVRDAAFYALLQQVMLTDCLCSCDPITLHSVALKQVG